MDRTTLVETFTHIIDGYDIPTPEGLLKVKREDAAKKIQGLPYSLLTNLAHAVLWQDLWMRSLRGEKLPPIKEIWANDFRVPEPQEWGSLRKEFVEGLNEAKRIAASEPFDHKLSSDEKAATALIQIAVHGAYHMGQLNLLKRAIRADKAKG